MAKFITWDVGHCQKEGTLEFNYTRFKLTNHPYYMKLHCCFKFVILALKLEGLLLWTHEKLISVSHTFFDGRLVTTNKIMTSFDDLMLTGWADHAIAISILVISRSLTLKQTFTPIKLSKDVIIFTNRPSTQKRTFTAIKEGVTSFRM